MKLKGQVRTFSIYGRPKIRDILSWHGNPTSFCIFWHKSLYTRAVVEQQAYTHLAKKLGSIYVEKYVFLALDLSKRGLISLHREMEKGPLCNIAMVRKILL
jgi:hypothetical protein